MLKELTTPTTLDPELDQHLETTGSFPALRHPLIYSVPYSPAFNKMLNGGLEQKRKSLVEAKDEREWMSVIMLHERPHRFNALEEIWPEIRRERRRAELFMDVWTDSENLWQTRDIWEQLLLELDPDVLRHAQSDEDVDVLDSLDDPLTVWRGGDPQYRQGLSWTLDRGKAEWFAGRYSEYGKEGEMYELTIPLDAVLFYYGGRGESEIVVHPDYID